MLSISIIFIFCILKDIIAPILSDYYSGSGNVVSVVTRVGFGYHTISWSAYTLWVIRSLNTKLSSNAPVRRPHPQPLSPRRGELAIDHDAINLDTVHNQ